MSRITDKTIRCVLKHFGLEDDPVAVVGISGGKIGVYDDRFYHVIRGDVTEYPGNVDPSKLDRGRATLERMRVFHWRAGIHGLSKPPGRRYAAFVQAEQVTVIRYQIGADTGMFGINHHRGGVASTSSLGCQTYPPNVWEDARRRLYKALGASESEVLARKSSGKPFPYVVVPLDKAVEIEGEAKPAPKADPPAAVIAPAWTIRIKGKPGQADEVYRKSINIAGRVFVPIRDFCSAALDCTPQRAPLKWKNGPGDEDELTVAGKIVEEYCEIDGRAYVWVVEAANALGFDLCLNNAARNIELTGRV
ncbi:MAG TPA: hypothetical protein VGE01_04605 [Fimbriimonas sp.]